MHLYTLNGVRIALLIAEQIAVEFFSCYYYNNKRYHIIKPPPNHSCDIFQALRYLDN